MTLKKIAELPKLDEDALDDAAFRAKDRGWASLARVFDDYRRTQGLSYAQVGRRIGRSRAQVQNWLGSPFNLTLKSLGLLSEALDADLIIDVRPRSTMRHSNYCHPIEEAQSVLQSRTAPVRSVAATAGPEKVGSDYLTEAPRLSPAAAVARPAAAEFAA